ncbi:uncharacterized protein LOC102291327 isoform X2 [Haplochromis burtoni]|uniref:uncharacterized protein LOC102291327 isoform X2 n=1 Tax=Haplochromis burtoni TaxID=8153 RepID=UPI001C2CFFAC|nr:uncharacterized protein LOC102291327 isoform X2 [Haplochromis burtoni]
MLTTERRAPSQDSTSKLTFEEKRYNPEDPTLTFVDRDDEMDFLCEDFKSLRALMSCGHAVTPMSLTKWCRRLLDQGESKFLCGQTGCDAEWSFEEVCKMALLTPEEIEYFEKKMFSNSKDFFDVKCCPGCKSSVLRADFSNLCVECTLCKADLNRTFMFCWQCLRKWRGFFFWVLSSSISSAWQDQQCMDDGHVLNPIRHQQGFVLQWLRSKHQPHFTN